MKYIIDYSVERPRGVVTGFVCISAKDEAQAEKIATSELAAQYPGEYVKIVRIVEHVNEYKFYKH